jgi:hypothetical protein
LADLAKLPLVTKQDQSAKMAMLLQLVIRLASAARVANQLPLVSKQDKTINVARLLQLVAMPASVIKANMQSLLVITQVTVAKVAMPLQLDVVQVLGAVIAVRQIMRLP